MIRFSYQQQFNIKERKKIKNWVQLCVEKLNKNIGQINYVFCDNTFIHELNLKHLQHDYTTDIITFDYTVGNILNGEIYISIDEVKLNSITYHTKFKDELHRVIIHGVLHLTGFKDKTDNESTEMKKQEDYYLSLRTF
jgi:rRNA maturation RNase YbeY